MADKKWTAAQQAAVEHREGALLVSAAAGSGKTAVLVERVVRMITREDGPVTADRLLIVTFTKAAAEELRARISSRLEEEVRRHAKNARLRRQRMLLRRAFIGTIDAFCQQVVRENFARLGLPPDIGVGEEALLAQLSQAALEETLEEAYANPDFAAFASLYGRARSDKTAQDAVLDLYAFTRTLARPGAHLAAYAAMYDGDTPLAETAWGEELLRYAQQALEAAENLTAQGAVLAAAEEAAGFYRGVFTGDLAAIHEAKKAVLAKKWDEAHEMIRNFAFQPLKAVPKCSVPVREQAKNMRRMLRDIIDNLQKYCFVCTEKTFKQDRERAGAMVRALVQAVERYSEVYFEAKMAEKALDFADFEQLALALLQGEAGDASGQTPALADRFDAVMVDEYQDTNELQDALYRCLARADGGNLFYVGDVKQSIYRFRKADPGIFLAKKAAWAEYGQGTGPSVLPLGHNFRSSRQVVAGVNYLFSLLMSPALGEVDYSRGEALLCGDKNAPEGSFEVCVVEDAAGAGDAAFVAQRIEEMVQNGTPVGKGEERRPCNYGDFCILLRARTHMASYLEELSKRGIPAVCDVAEEITVAPEVLPLMATLAAIDNPGDDINLAAAMMGPLFRFSPDEMTRLRAGAPQGNLWGALAASEEEKTRGFVAALKVYRTLASQMSAGRLCEELVERTGYLSAVAAMEDGEARQENLLRFIGWAKEASAAGRGGLAGFVRLLAAGKGPVGAPAKSIPGYVSILTIHKSKGLEFPVCFLADTAAAFNTRDLSARVQMHTALGVGLSLREGNVLVPTLPALAIRRRRETEAMSEEMRVLYVALTRAKEHMIVTFAHKDPAAYLATRAAGLCGGMPDAFLLAGARSMGEWILSAVLCHPDAEPLRALLDGMELPMAEAEGRLVVRLDQLPETEEAPAEAFALTAQPDAAFVSRLEAAFAVVPARAGLQEVPAKMSVSALVKQAGSTVRKRPSFMYKNGLTAAEAGTAQHSFMQYADFENARRNADAEVERLCKEGFLEEAQAAAVNRAGVRAFFASPLAARMEKADRVLREYDFITAVPAGQVKDGLPSALANEPVLVQGIADAVLVRDGQAEIVDYKTDHGKSATALAGMYGPQLLLYRKAIEKALGLPVTKLTLWSFALSGEVDVPL